nr:zinc finger BED domain-containing protein RICESLEEPER 2-like [Ipomoea batatas]
MLDSPSLDAFVSPLVVLPTRAQPDPLVDDSDSGCLVVKIRAQWVNDLEQPFSGSIVFLLLIYVDMVVPRVVPSLRGWRSSHLKARQLSEIRSGGFGRGVVEGALVAASDHVGQSVRVGSTGHEADGARVRDSSGEGTIVKVTGEKRGAEGRRRLVTGELRVKPTVERLVSREEIDEEQSTGCRARQQPTVQASTKCRRQAVGGDATGAYEFRSRLTSIEHLSKLTLVSFDILYVYC